MSNCETCFFKQHLYCFTHEQNVCSNVLCLENDHKQCFVGRKSDPANNFQWPPLCILCSKAINTDDVDSFERVFCCYLHSHSQCLEAAHLNEETKCPNCSKNIPKMSVKNALFGEFDMDDFSGVEDVEGGENDPDRVEIGENGVKKVEEKRRKNTDGLIEKQAENNFVEFNEVKNKIPNDVTQNTAEIRSEKSQKITENDEKLVENQQKALKHETTTKNSENNIIENKGKSDINFIKSLEQIFSFIFINGMGIDKNSIFEQARSLGLSGDTHFMLEGFMNKWIEFKNDKDKKISDVKSEKDMLQSQLKKLEETSNKNVEENKKLKSDFENSNKKNSKLKHLIQKKETEVSQIVKETEIALKNIKKRERTYRSLTAKLEESNRRVSQLENYLETTKNSLKTTEEDLSSVKSSQKKSQDSLELQSKEKEQLKAENSSLKNNLELAEKTLNHSVNQFETALKQKTSTIDELNQKNLDSEKSILNRKESDQKTEEIINERDSLIKALKVSRESSKSTKEKLEAAKSTALDTEKSMKDKISAHEKEKESLMSKIKNLEQRTDEKFEQELELRTKKLRVENETIFNDFKSKLEKISDEKAETDKQYETRIKELGDRNMYFEKELDRITEVYKTNRESIEETWDRKILTVESELEAIKKKSSEEVIRLKEEKASSENELTQKLNEVEVEKRRIQSDLAEKAKHFGSQKKSLENKLTEEVKKTKVAAQKAENNYLETIKNLETARAQAEKENSDLVENSREKSSSLLEKASKEKKGFSSQIERLKKSLEEKETMVGEKIKIIGENEESLKDAKERLKEFLSEKMDNEELLLSNHEEKENLKCQMRNFEEEKFEVEKILQQVRRKADLLEKEKKSIIENLNATKSRLENQNAGNLKKSKEVQALNKTISSVKESNKKLAAEITKSEQMYEEIRIRFENYQKENENEKIVGIKVKQGRKKKMDDVNRKIKLLKQSLQSVKNFDWSTIVPEILKISKNHPEYDSHTDIIEFMSQEVSKCNTELAKYSQSLTNSRKEKNQLEEKLKSLKSSLNSEKENLKILRSSAEKEKLSLNKKISSLSKELKESKSTSSSLNSSIKDLNQNQMHLSKVTEDMSAEVGRLNEELFGANNASAELKAKNEEERQKCEKAEKELETIKTGNVMENECTAREIKEKDSKISILKEKLKNLESELDEKSKQGREKLKEIEIEKEKTNKKLELLKKREKELEAGKSAFLSSKDENPKIQSDISEFSRSDNFREITLENLKKIVKQLKSFDTDSLFKTTMPLNQKQFPDSNVPNSAMSENNNSAKIPSGQITKPVKTKNQTAENSARNETSVTKRGGLISWLCGSKNDDGKKPKVYKVDLSQHSSGNFYYDKEKKKWVNKDGDSENEEDSSQALPPPKVAEKTPKLGKRPQKRADMKSKKSAMNRYAVAGAGLGFGESENTDVKTENTPKTPSDTKKIPPKNPCQTNRTTNYQNQKNLNMTSPSSKLTEDFKKLVANTIRELEAVIKKIESRLSIETSPLKGGQKKADLSIKNKAADYPKPDPGFEGIAGHELVRQLAKLISEQREESIKNEELRRDLKDVKKIAAEKLSTGQLENGAESNLLAKGVSVAGSRRRSIFGKPCILTTFIFISVLLALIVEAKSPQSFGMGDIIELVDDFVFKLRRNGLYFRRNNIF